MRRLPVVLACLLLLAAAAVAMKKPEPEPQSNLSFSVVKAENGKPIRNASVILHPLGTRGHQQNTGFQLKTDAEGKAAASGVPYGTLRVQVIAHGFQTYGEDFEISQPTQEIVIQLKPPQQQFTIYK